MIALFLHAALAYFIPTIIALSTRKRDRAAIVVLNLFLGWTLIGWVIALVWAVKQDPANPRTLSVRGESRRRGDRPLLPRRTRNKEGLTLALDERRRNPPGEGGEAQQTPIFPLPGPP